MKLYFTNFEIYHNISIYLFYFIFLERPRSPWEVHAEHRLGTSGVGSMERWENLSRPTPSKTLPRTNISTTNPV